jgi:hypothetical protein
VPAGSRPNSYLTEQLPLWHSLGIACGVKITTYEEETMNTLPDNVSTFDLGKRKADAAGVQVMPDRVAVVSSKLPDGSFADKSVGVSAALMPHGPG